MLFAELAKFWLDELYVLSKPKFYVATPKIISKYFGSIFKILVKYSKRKYLAMNLNVATKI